MPSETRDKMSSDWVPDICQSIAWTACHVPVICWPTTLDQVLLKIMGMSIQTADLPLTCSNIWPYVPNPQSIVHRVCCKHSSLRTQSHSRNGISVINQGIIKTVLVHIYCFNLVIYSATKHVLLVFLDDYWSLWATKVKALYRVLWSWVPNF